MSYRLPPTPPKVREPPAIAFGAGRPLHIIVDNNTITRINVPCFYARRFTRYDKMIWDHMTWPYPNHPDGSNYSRILAMQDVDLEEEGYTAIDVFVNRPLDVTVSATLDHNHVVITIDAHSSSAESDDIDVKFAIYASGQNSEVGNMKDLITKGTVHVIAGLGS